jgi:hypothetical protein
MLMEPCVDRNPGPPKFLIDQVLESNRVPLVGDLDTDNLSLFHLFDEGNPIPPWRGTPALDGGGWGGDSFNL